MKDAGFYKIQCSMHEYQIVYGAQSNEMLDNLRAYQHQQSFLLAFHELPIFSSIHVYFQAINNNNNVECVYQRTTESLSAIPVVLALQFLFKTRFRFLDFDVQSMCIIKRLNTKKNTFKKNQTCLTLLYESRIQNAYH